MTEILSNRIPSEVYQGFYVYLYVLSISFVVFVYVSQLRRKAMLTIIKSYRKLDNTTSYSYINCLNMTTFRW